MNMNLGRRRFVQRLAGIAAGAPLLSAMKWAAGGSPMPDKPNILWLVAEDCCPDLGCYGNPLARTPRLDAFAAEGMRFTNAFCTGPVCSPSRSALATGMYQTSIGAHHHRSHRTDGYRLPEGVRTVMDRLRDAGYFTCNATFTGEEPLKPGKTDFNFTCERPHDGVDWRECPKDRPFFATVNFYEAHRGGSWKEIEGMPVRTDPASVVVPPYYPDDPVVRRDLAEYHDVMSLLDLKAGRVLDRLAADGLADNTVVFFFGDNGRPLVRGKQWLYDPGIHEPLLLRVPERFLALVRNLEKAPAAPARARLLPVLDDPPVAPCAYAPGGVFDGMVSHIDITATTLQLAGVPLPENMEGRPLFGGPAPGYVVAARDRCDETRDRARCVRTRRFKYIRNFMADRPYAQPNRYTEQQYPVLALLKERAKAGTLKGSEALFMAPRKAAEELYDLAADPHEVENLAEAPEHADTLRLMRGLLDGWTKATGDKGGEVEPPEAANIR